MSKRSAVLSLGVAAVLAWAVSAPYRALGAIKAAAEAGDVESLRDRVDFPAVRESVKEQLRAMMAREMSNSAADLDDNPFAAAGAALGSMFADAMIEKMVGAFVSAEGLQEMFRAQMPAAAGGKQAPAEKPESRLRFRGLSRFEARYWSPDSPDHAISLHLRRRGLAWVLTSITFDALAKASDSRSGASPKPDPEAQRETVSKMRNTGTALMAWLIDESTPAAAGRASVAVRSCPLLTLEQVHSLLVPKYIRAADISSEDGWGHPCEIRVNRNDLDATPVMVIRCPGRDGRFDAEAYEVGGFNPTDFDADIVWWDGFFVRWPQKKS